MLGTGIEVPFSLEGSALLLLERFGEVRFWRGICERLRTVLPADFSAKRAMIEFVLSQTHGCVLGWESEAFPL